MSNIEQNFSPKTQPLSHQIESIEHIIEHNQIALFDEQGLGKTKIVIDALCTSMKKKEIEGALVIAPMSLVYNWEKEIEKHSFLIPIVLRGSKREKRYKFLTGANFYITNYEAVLAENQRIKRFCKSRKTAIVLDESARIKDPEAKTTKAIFELRAHSEKRIIITGTPIANKPYDLWAQFYFLDNGKLFGDNYKNFKSKLNENNVYYQSELDKLKDILAQNSIRRCKQDVLELPEKVFTNIYVNLDGKQLSLYEKLRDELRIEILAINGEKVIDEAENILKRLLRLIQIASNPLLIDKGYDETPAKFKKIQELVKGILAKGEKTIIWTGFVENILILKNKFKLFNPLVIYGDVPIKDRTEAVAKFQESEKYRLMIANPAAAREGLTLTSANNAIYLDRNFNLADYLQSQDRIHRISQTKRCNIYKILAKKTIDEYVDKVIEFKADIAGFVQGDRSKLQPESSEFILNKQELLEMLGG